MTLKKCVEREKKLAVTVPDNALDSTKKLNEVFREFKKEKHPNHTTKRDFLTAATIRLKKKINFLT